MAISTPISSFTMTLTGNDDSMIFDVFEVKHSRELASTYTITYNVIANPHNDTLMSDLIFSDAERTNLGNISDEVLIAWNVWVKAGDSFFDSCMAKKWPPDCTRIGSNQYEVTIHYAPLFLTSFNITPLRTKLFQDRLTDVYELSGNSFTWVNQNSMSDEELMAHSYINTEPKTGKVQGVDVLDPIFNWTERWSWGPHDQLVLPGPEDYLDSLTKLSCTVNSAPFRGFKRSQVLFRAASGRYVSPMVWEIDYSFSARPIKQTLNLGGRIIELGENHWATGGWNVVEVDYVDNEVTITRNGSKVIMPKPRFVRIHEVYKFGDFSILQTFPSIPLSKSRHLTLVETLPTIGGVHWPPPVEATFS